MASSAGVFGVLGVLGVIGLFDVERVALAVGIDTVGPLPFLRVLLGILQRDDREGNR